MSHTPTDAVQECETLLRKMVEDLRAKRIWPNLCSIIDGLLNRRIELAEVHKEVHAALAQSPRALYVFWDVFLHAADGWNPQKSRAARQAREELVPLIDLLASWGAPFQTRPALKIQRAYFDIRRTES